MKKRQKEMWDGVVEAAGIAVRYKSTTQPSGWTRVSLLSIVHHLHYRRSGISSVQVIRRHTDAGKFVVMPDQLERGGGSRGVWQEVWWGG